MTTEEIAGEVAALDRILTRLALTEEDALEALLSKLLPLLIEKLGGPEAVRKKTLELLSHINKRVKAVSKLKLPLAALLTSWQTSANLLTRNFALVYIEQAFERATDEEKFSALPALAKGIAAKPEPQREILLRLITQSLEYLSRPSLLFNSNAEDPELTAKCQGFLENEPDRGVLSAYFLDLMLYHPVSAPRVQAQDPLQQFMAMQRANPQPVAVGGAQVVLTGDEGQGEAPPAPPAPLVAPGLHLKAMKSLEAKGKPTLDQLAQKKLGILNFTVKVGLSPQLCIALYTVAAADPADSVSRRGEELMKRRLALDTNKPLADLEDPAVVANIFELLLGTTPEQAELARVPVGALLAPRLFQLATKSRTAASSFPSNLAAVNQWLAHPKTNLRAQQAAMEFAIAVFRHGDAFIFTRDVLASVTRTLLCQLAGLDGESELLQGGSAEADDQLKQAILARSSEGASSQTSMLRSFSFQAIGLLAEKSANNFATLPMVLSGFLPDLLFAVLPLEAPSVKPSLQETLRQLALALGFKGRGQGRVLGRRGDDMEVDDLPSVAPASSEFAKETGQLASLLMEGIGSPSDSVRLAAAQWANAILAPQSALGRYLCMLAAGDVKTEVKEEGLRGVDPERIIATLKKEHTQAGGAQEAALSLLSSFLDLIGSKHPQLTGPADLEAPLALKPKSYTSALELGLTLWHFGTGSAASAAANVTDETFERLCSFVDHALNRNAPKEVVGSAANCLLSLLQGDADRARFVKRYASMLSWLKSAGLAHSTVPVRHAFAKIIGAAASLSSLDAPEVSALVKSLAADVSLPSTEGQAEPSGTPTPTTHPKVRYEVMDGSILALGYLVGLNHGSPAASPQAWAALKAALPWSQQGAGKDVQLQCSAAEAVAAALSSSHVPKGEASTVQLLEEAGTKIVALAVLADIGEVDRPAVLRGLRSAGLLGIAARKLGGEAGERVSDSLLAAVFKAATSKRSDLEIILAAADALSCIVGFLPVTTAQVLLNDTGSLQDLIARSKGAGPLPEPPAPSDTPRITKVLEDLTSPALCGSSESNKRRGGCVLLHALVSANGKGAGEAVSGILSRLQSVFSSLLFDATEVTQSYASLGLSAIYALGDQETKQRLVESLTKMLRGEGVQAQGQLKIDSDTKVFEEGALGNLPGGGRLTTYAELCSLANDVNKPDLIYKLMDLAHHNAALRSRAGAASGLSAILQQTQAQEQAETGAAENAKLKSELSSELATMLPKIYRGLYDPEPSVAGGMQNIWRSLVDDPSDALTKHFNVVVDALLKDITDRLWRHREAGCAALADLLQGRTWPEVKGKLAEIWAITFRAVDDVKESVRKAALQLAKTLRSLTIKLTDVKNGASPREASEVVTALLEQLLQKGIPSPVREVKALSVDLVGNMVRNGDSASLRPHLTELVPALIECLSGTEDARLSYYEQHVESVGISKDSFQSARVAASRSHPLGEALDSLARLVEEDAVVELVPRLAATIKRGVGLTTRCGAARFVSQLCLRIGPALRAPAPQLIKALIESMRVDASGAVRKANAQALAALFKFSSPSRLDKTLEDLTSRVTAGQDSRDDRLVLGLILEEFVRGAPDAFPTVQAKALPLAFLFKYDKEDEELAAVFSSVWEQGAPSEATTLSLLSAETVALLLGPDGLTSSSWARKRMAARALQQLAVKGAASPQIKDRAPAIVRALLAELLTPRAWEGKETLLAALGEASVSFGFEALGGDLATEVVSGLVACLGKRSRKEWVQAALACAKQVARGLSEGVDVLTPLWPTLKEALTAPPSSDSEKKDGNGGTQREDSGAETGAEKEATPGQGEEDKERKKPPPLVDSLSVLETALEHSRQAKDQPAFVEELARDLTAVLSRNLPWSTRVATLQVVKQLPLSSASTSFVSALLPAVLVGLDDLKIAQVRERALEAARKLLRTPGVVVPADLLTATKQKLETSVSRETDALLKDEMQALLKSLSQ